MSKQNHENDYDAVQIWEDDILFATELKLFSFVYAWFFYIFLYMDCSFL